MPGLDPAHGYAPYILVQCAIGHDEKDGRFRSMPTRSLSKQLQNLRRDWTVQRGSVLLGRLEEKTRDLSY